MSSFETDALGTLPSGYTIKYNGTGTANQKVVNTVVKNGAQSLPGGPFLFQFFLYYFFC